MSSKTKTTATTEEVKPALVPRLRFPEFRGAKGWESGKVDDLVDTVTPPKKLPTASYASSGAFPIIDQSQSDICGWTDDNEALVREDLPLIVFGDHTCILKLISRPFAQGADGIKILKSRSKVGTPFLFQFLSHRPVVTEEYKRHYSILKEKTVFFPEFKSGEQQKIAECLSSVDELMAAQALKVDALKTHKKGLMQQLFLREGDDCMDAGGRATQDAKAGTQPRLRFPEFQNAGEWSAGILGGLSQIVRGGSPRPIDGFLTTAADGLNWLKIGDVDKEAKFVTRTAEKVRPEALSKTRVVHPGDLILSNSMSFGRPYILQIKTCIHDGWIAITHIANKTDRDFLYYSISAPSSQSYFVDNAAGSGVQNLNADIIKGLPVCFPAIPEQQRIASCLSSLDALITLESQKLDALKTHKKGLMQQLFPSVEGVEA